MAVALAVLLLLFLTGVRMTAQSPWTFEGIGIRTPIGPGQIKFVGCSETQLDDFSVIPEDDKGAPTPPAGNNVWHDADGFWYRNHTPANEWFKVGNHCDLTVYCEQEGGFSMLAECNWAATWIKGWPDWSSITLPPDQNTNPFGP